MNHKMEGNLTPKARKIWQAIPGDIQLKILNNVWCVQCGGVTGIGNVNAKMESGMLVFRGICIKCGGEVARPTGNA